MRILFFLIFCGSVHAADEAEWKWVEGDFSFAGNGLCEGPLTWEKVCGKAKDTCIKHDRADSCYGYYDDLFTMERRRTSLRYLYERFTELKNNREMIKTCCGNSEVCARSFTNTELRLENQSSGQPWYNPVTKKVFVSEAMIAKCATKGCWDRILFHELGHACQHSRSGFGWPILATSCRNVSYHREEVQALFGPAVWRCLSMVPELMLEGRSGCPGARLQEVFANFVFLSRWQSLAAWAYTCTGGSDFFHAAPRTYGHCFFEQAETQQYFCPKDSQKPPKPVFSIPKLPNSTQGGNP